MTYQFKDKTWPPFIIMCTCFMLFVLSVSQIINMALQKPIPISGVFAVDGLGQ